MPDPFQNMMGARANVNWLVNSHEKKTTTVTNVPERSQPRLLHHTCPFKQI